MSCFRTKPTERARLVALVFFASGCSHTGDGSGAFGVEMFVGRIPLWSRKSWVEQD